MSQAGVIKVSFEDLGAGQPLRYGTWGLFAPVPGWAATRAHRIEIGQGGTHGFHSSSGLELDAPSHSHAVASYEDELSAVVAAGSSPVEFRRAGAWDSRGALTDNVQSASVPDAGMTAALFGIALAGLGYFRKTAR